MVLALVLGAAVWSAWLGWDDEYYWDESVGAFQCPYRKSQVIGCAVTYGLVAALLSLRWHPFPVALGLAGGFWTGWTLQAAATAESGLFLVGALALGPGLVVGGLVAGLCGVIAHPLLRRGPRVPHVR